MKTLFPRPGKWVLLLSFLAVPAGVYGGQPASGDDVQHRPIVILLHGLARSASSMEHMERALGDAGYRVCNIDYPSREHGIAELASQFVAPAIARCRTDSTGTVNFVTHSLGGIIVRQLAEAGLVRNIGRVVMLGPPNQGSELVDTLGDWTLFRKINGPAGAELGTSKDSTARRLGAASFQAGVIAGNRSINWINSLIIPGSDDGKVSLERTRLDGTRDHVVVAASHPFLMRDRAAIAQTLQFLASGCFMQSKKDAASKVACVPDGGIAQVPGT